jgi:hypothetical protein
MGIATLDQGWSWSMCVKPLVNTNSCQSSHTSCVISIRMKVKMDDGAEIEEGPGDTDGHSILRV